MRLQNRQNTKENTSCAAAETLAPYQEYRQYHNQLGTTVEGLKKQNASLHALLASYLYQADLLVGEYQANRSPTPQLTCLLQQLMGLSASIFNPQPNSRFSIQTQLKQFKKGTDSASNTFVALNFAGVMLAAITFLVAVTSLLGLLGVGLDTGSAGKALGYLVLGAVIAGAVCFLQKKITDEIRGDAVRIDRRVSARNQLSQAANKIALFKQKQRSTPDPLFLAKHCAAPA